MSHFLRSRLRAIRCAGNGILYTLRTQGNTWLYGFLSLLVIGLAFALKLSQAEILWILAAVFAVWVTELLNTAIETLVDLTTPQQHPLARIAKDVSAAAVLLTAIFAVLVGLMVFGPPLLRFLGFEG